jgi:indole-3-glycerol phosphate synthase
LLGFGDYLGRVTSQRGIRVDACVATGGDEFEETAAGRFFGETLSLGVHPGDVHSGAGVELLLADLLPDLAGGEKRVQRRGQVLEDRGLHGPLLPEFDLFPLRDDRVRRSELRAVTEDVGVTPYHLLVHLAGDVVKSELSGFLGHLRMHRHMEQEVAEFLPEVRDVVAVDRLDEFGHFFDEAVADAAVRLLPVPRAAVGGAESGGGREQEVDAGHDLMQEARRKGVKTIARSHGSACLSPVDKLTEIMDAKRREIAPFARPVTDAELAAFAGRETSPGFRQSLKVPDRLTVIAEVKRASPSVGQIREAVDAVAQARAYFAAGADCLSVLTETKYFKGELKDLVQVVQDQTGWKRPLPCIRKDFMVHPYQVLEAAQAGARCILIIVRGLTDEEIRPIHRAAKLAGLDTLFEVHDEAELERALRHDPDMVGVNNRNLSTFQIDLSFAERVIPHMPKSVLKVAESGIKTADDAARMRAAGADALLVGESLMRAADPAALMKALQSA